LNREVTALDIRLVEDTKLQTQKELTILKESLATDGHKASHLEISLKSLQLQFATKCEELKQMTRIKEDKEIQITQIESERREEVQRMQKELKEALSVASRQKEYELREIHSTF
jgi:hypothetical protein